MKRDPYFPLFVLLLVILVPLGLLYVAAVPQLHSIFESLPREKSGEPQSFADELIHRITSGPLLGIISVGLAVLVATALLLTRSPKTS